MSFDAYTTVGLNLFQPLAINAQRDPTTSDLIAPNGNPYLLAQEWINTLVPSVPRYWTYAGAGIWIFIGSGGATGSIVTLTGTTGGPISPSAGNVNLLGTANQVVVTGSPNTETISLTGPYTPATYTPHGVLMGEGTSSIVASSAGTLGQVFTSGGASADGAYQTIGTNSALTSNGIILGGGTGAFTATPALTSGQTLVGVTGGPPVAQTITNSKVTSVPLFTELPVMSASTGGVAAVTINTTNLWAIPQWGAYFEQYNTTVSTNIAPVMSATAGFGLNIDNIGAAAAKTIEITEGNSVNSKNAFVVGTAAAFYVQATFNINTLADVTDLYVGFRKVQAYQATVPAGYTDYATLGVHGAAGLIESQTQVASGGNVITTSGISAIAGTSFTVRVNVSAAGVVTYAINGSPATTAAYTFTGALTVIPYMLYTSVTGHAEVDLVAYQCGLL